MPKPYFCADNFNCHQSLGYLTRRVQNLTNPHAEAIFADQDLTFTQWISLMGLREGVAETSADLARHLNHDAGAVTRVVDELEKRGLLRRERSKSDRRVVKLILTPQGRAVAKMHVPPIVHFWNRVTDEFSTAEIKQLLSLMTRLIARLEAEPMHEPAAKEKVKAKKRAVK
ncbi:MAG: MarR family transcriptional regulator [Proteobacteria bacterium]|nr:MarR family transcriptional regulator [Pseudomonadota bacterium]